MDPRLIKIEQSLIDSQPPLRSPCVSTKPTAIAVFSPLCKELARPWRQRCKNRRSENNLVPTYLRFLLGREVCLLLVLGAASFHGVPSLLPYTYAVLSH